MNSTRHKILVVAVVCAIAAGLIVVQAVATLYSQNSPEITSGTTIQVEINGSVPTSGSNTQITDGSTVALSVVTASGGGLSSAYSSVAYYYVSTAPTLPITSIPSGATGITTVTSTDGGTFSYSWTTVPEDQSIYVFAVAS
jgi:hypothetical protein